MQTATFNRHLLSPYYCVPHTTRSTDSKRRKDFKDGWIKIPCKFQLVLCNVKLQAEETYKEFRVYYTNSLKILNPNICVSYQNLFLSI